jgi:hypothetical protein
MKLQSSDIRTLRGGRAFTLVEALVASTTLVILLGSVIMCNLFGLSMAVRQQIWLGASDDAAQAIGRLMGDIRSAVTLQVGTNLNNVFTPASSTGQQSGTALRIFTNSTGTASAGPWILYYYDSTSNYLVRTNFNGRGVAGDCKLVSANSITNDNNHPIFTEVSYTGTPLTTAVPTAPISVYLSFTKLQDPDVVIENGSVVDLYQIITTVTPRMGL